MLCTLLRVGIRPPLPNDSSSLLDFGALLFCLHHGRFGVRRRGRGLDLFWESRVIINVIVISEGMVWIGNEALVIIVWIVIAARLIIIVFIDAGSVHTKRSSSWSGASTTAATILTATATSL